MDTSICRLANDGSYATSCTSTTCLPGASRAIRSAGGEAIGNVCDISDPVAVARLIQQTKEKFGTIDGLVNNAAMFATIKPKKFEEIDSAEFDRIMPVNVRGTFECIKAVLPIMRSQKYGKIVNIASGTVFKGTPMMLAYVSSKGAVIALTRAVAREVGRDGICVNCVAPGLTLSEGVKSSDDSRIGSVSRGLAQI